MSERHTCVFLIWTLSSFFFCDSLSAHKNVHLFGMNDYLIQSPVASPFFSTISAFQCIYMRLTKTQKKIFPFTLRLPTHLKSHFSNLLLLIYQSFLKNIESCIVTDIYTCWNIFKYWIHTSSKKEKHTYHRWQNLLQQVLRHSTFYDNFTILNAFQLAQPLSHFNYRILTERNLSSQQEHTVCSETYFHFWHYFELNLILTQFWTTIFLHFWSSSLLTVTNRLGMV